MLKSPGGRILAEILCQAGIGRIVNLPVIDWTLGTPVIIDSVPTVLPTPDYSEVAR